MGHDEHRPTARSDDGPPPDGQPPDGVETPRRYWVGVVIVVLAILLVIGMSLVLFVASDPPTSSTAGVVGPGATALGVTPG